MTEVSQIQTSKCPSCGQEVDVTAFYCQNCGKKIREKPPGTGVGAQVLVYALSLFLPPLNIPLSFKYLRMQDIKSKRIGWISLVIMAVSLVVITWWTVNTINEVNRQIGLEMGKYTGF